MLQQILKYPKLIIEGPAGSGKTTFLLEIYKHLVEKQKVPSNNILIILLNRAHSLKWRTKTILKHSGNVWRTSYYGFIQQELTNYYPILLKACHDISIKRLKPLFLTLESAQFIVSQAIAKEREKNGLFPNLTSQSEKIALDLVSNIVKASISDIPYHEIGSKLFNSLEHKDDIKKQIFKDADTITDRYRKKCISLGIFDFGTSVDLYNKYILKDKNYQSNLSNRITHLIVDNVEELVPSAIDFIELLLPNLKGCYIGYNNEGGYGQAFGSNHKYASSKLLNKLDKFKLDKCHTCNNFMYEFSDMLFNNIQNSNKNKFANNIIIEKNSAVNLRSEMLENVSEKVCNLIFKEKYSPSDIVVLSTYADPVTEFVLSNSLERRGVYIRNISRTNRIVDNQFTKALLTLSELCHPQYRILPTRESIKSLIRLILKIDPIRSSLLANEIICQKPFASFPDIEFPGLVERIGYHNIEKYEYIRNWIDNYRQISPLPAHQFFQRVFLEVLISKDVSEVDITETKKLIDSAQNFVEILSQFSGNKCKLNASRNFITMAKRGMKSGESIFQIEEKFDSKNVTLSTPVSFLASPLYKKIVILTSLSSKNWSPRNLKELTNVHVLTKTWDDNYIYTEELEEQNQKKYLSILLRSIIKRCSDKLITFESNLSSNGFENIGFLSEYFEEIL